MCRRRSGLKQRGIMGLENNSDKNNWVGVGTIGRKRYVGTRSSNR